MRVSSPGNATTLSGDIAICLDWDVLGPFQTGTREATWGADPLERWGGFRNLSAAKDGPFRSSLGCDGLVGWSRQSSEIAEQSKNAMEVKGAFAFSDVDWMTLRSYYGWSALQYQGWARTSLTIKSGLPRTVAIHISGTLEFWIDDLHFFGGDFYSYRRAPVILALSEGLHRLDIRLTRDIRSMGGSSVPTCPFAVRVEIVEQDLIVESSKALLPEIISARALSSHWGSVPLTNANDKDLEITAIRSIDNAYQVKMVSSHSFVLLPGQSRPLQFRLSSLHLSSELIGEIEYRVGVSKELQTRPIRLSLENKELNETFRYTFLHPSGTVSFATLRRPTHGNNGAENEQLPTPVLLNLHGAGLEADSHQVRHQFDAISHLKAWTVFPSGVTTWSGDDWHTWGFRDVEAAVAAIPQVLNDISWSGPSVDVSKLFVVGHSNGGQGTWFALTHKPDLIAAAAPISGYLSIQAYVSYNMWTEMDPRIWMCLQNVLSSYRHELLVSNFAGIPVIQQHGSLDDNVPPFHSRRLAQLSTLSGSSSEYHELPGKGHWFDGIMTTAPLLAFYNAIDASNESRVLPERFRLVVPHSADMGSRGGLQVDQLMSPDSVGVIEVDRSGEPTVWTIATTNIHRFRFVSCGYKLSYPVQVEVDGISFAFAAVASDCLTRSKEGVWKIVSLSEMKCLSQRYGNQVGALDSILRTRDAFVIQMLTAETKMLALQVARNLYQYFGADCCIVSDSESHGKRTGNIVKLAVGTHTVHRWSQHPISISSEGVSIALFDGIRRFPSEPGLGAIFLVPREDEGLELCVWGSDEQGLSQAARLLPMLTGVGQPDFVVTSRESRWKGAAGSKAMGFFDRDWRVSRASFV